MTHLAIAEANLFLLWFLLHLSIVRVRLVVRIRVGIVVGRIALHIIASFRFGRIGIDGWKQVIVKPVYIQQWFIKLYISSVSFASGTHFSQLMLTASNETAKKPCHNLVNNGVLMGLCPKSL